MGCCSFPTIEDWCAFEVRPGPVEDLQLKYDNVANCRPVGEKEAPTVCPESNARCWESGSQKIAVGVVAAVGS